MFEGGEELVTSMFREADYRHNGLLTMVPVPPRLSQTDLVSCDSRVVAAPVSSHRGARLALADTCLASTVQHPSQATAEGANVPPNVSCVSRCQSLTLKWSCHLKITFRNMLLLCRWVQPARSHLVPSTNDEPTRNSVDVFPARTSLHSMGVGACHDYALGPLRHHTGCLPPSGSVKCVGPFAC